MEQLLCHLVGDYILQTDTQARMKAINWKYCAIHAFTYTLPFLFLTRSVPVLLIICLTHYVIDYYRLARFPSIAKNILDNPREVFTGLYNTSTGFKADTPAWLSGWLFIVVDNTMHLTINYAALRLFA